MNLKEFLAAILPTQGNYYTAHITDTGSMRQYPHANLEQAAASIKAIANKHLNAFIATGSFGSKRSQVACKFKRVWYVDIDCKPGGQYETKEEGKAAIRAALLDGLPPFSILVDSGNGYHPYWVCTEDVAKTDWKGYAKAVAAACKKHNLNIDPPITEDEARILRAPGTLNYKDPKHPKPCKIVSTNSKYDYSFNEFAAAFNSYLTGPAAVGVPLADNSDLFDGLDYKEAKAQLMIDLCPVFSTSQATHGEHDSEPLWHKIIHTLVYCTDGDQFAHPLSDAHPGYSVAKTNRKFAHSLQSKDRTGPVTCAKFSELSSECNDCQWRGKIKSPIKLAFGKPNELPWPWKVGDKGVEKSTEDGWEQVIRYPVKEFKAVVEPGVATHISVVVGKALIHTSLDKLVVDNRTCNTILSNYGVSLDTYELEEFKRLMNAWLHQLQLSKQISVGADRFGWLSGSNFHYAGTIYSAHGDARTQIADKAMAETFSPHGALEPWQTCANHILGQPRHASWAIIASAFAAPLLRFTGVSGAVLSIVSQDTGTGKSTSMQIAAGVWGNPKSSMASLDDTPNSVANRLGVLNTLPAYWDEVREKEHVQRFITNVFRLAQGREKTRLNSNIQQRKAGEWETMLVIASNDPLKDHILQTVGNSDAGVARVFELRAEPIAADGMSDGAARHFYSQLKTNYGNAGEVYAEWLSRHQDQAENLVRHLDSTLSSRLDTKQDERFWVATIASLIAGAQLATDLGLCQFDTAVFKRYLIDRLLAMRTVKKEEYSTPLERSIELVTRYMHEKKQYIVHAKKMPKRGSSNEIIHHNEKHPALIRIGREDKIIRLLQKDFEDWYYNMDGSGQSHIIDNLVAAGAKKTRGAIDTGVAGGIGGRLRCVDVPFSKKALSALTPDY